jgi:hypothetical protein
LFFCALDLNSPAKLKILDEKAAGHEHQGLTRMYLMELARDGMNFHAVLTHFDLRAERKT